MAATCPVCGAALHGRAVVVTGPHRTRAFSCPTCGRFSAPDDVLAALAHGTPPERLAVSYLLQLRTAAHRRGVPLRRRDLPARLAGCGEPPNDPPG